MAPPKDRPRIGVLCSDANPPENSEFVYALKAMAEFELDHVAYVVTDGRYTDERLAAFHEQRCDLAKSACQAYEPLIWLSDIGTIREEPGTTVMANGHNRLLVGPEDLAFRLFRLNPDERFAMVFLTNAEHCNRVTSAGDDDTINKLVANLKNRLHGFDPALHQVMVVFIGSLTGIPAGITFDAEEQALIDNGTLSLEFMPPIQGVACSLGSHEWSATKDGAIPFETFHGFLKQHAHEDLSTREQELFDLLFPSFQGSDENEKVHAKAVAAVEEAARQSSENEDLLRRLVLLPPQRRYRRFSGLELPRKRYFTVCSDADGYDAQTLAHELRAYRNPIDLGMVEVFDLAEGCILQIGSHKVQLEQQSAIAVLIHHPERLPHRLLDLAFQRAPGLSEHTQALIYRFPYRVHPYTIERTIDLRKPTVRDWFYSRFRELSKQSLARKVSSAFVDPPTIAYSRFHFENGEPPVPSDFWGMLPTLVNPDLGGGNLGDTGSTLVMVGHWMRQNDVGALIYPSARCDCNVAFDGGELTHWEGWNLLDYRDSPLPSSPARTTTLVHSAWAWQRLPSEVQLRIADPESHLSGSFAIEGMVSYWARDYLCQLKALDIARARHGYELSRTERNPPRDDLPMRAFQIGTLMLGWVRRLLEGTSADAIQDVVLELQGLALPYGMYPMTGRISELWDEIKRGHRVVMDAIGGSLATMDRVAQFLEHEHAGRDLHRLARIGADHEMILLWLAVVAQANGRVAEGTDANVAQLMVHASENLDTPWLDDELRADIKAFHVRAQRTLKVGEDPADRLKDGIELERLVYESLIAR